MPPSVRQGDDTRTNVCGDLDLNLNDSVVWAMRAPLAATSIRGAYRRERQLKAALRGWSPASLAVLMWMTGVALEPRRKWRLSTRLGRSALLAHVELKVQASNPRDRIKEDGEEFRIGNSRPANRDVGLAVNRANLHDQLPVVEGGRPRVPVSN